MIVDESWEPSHSFFYVQLYLSAYEEYQLQMLEKWKVGQPL